MAPLRRRDCSRPILAIGSPPWTHRPSRVRVARPPKQRREAFRKMEKASTKRTKIGRRTVLKLAAGAGIAGASGISLAPSARAADTTLAIWTGFPELQPYYEAVAKAYASVHPEVKFTFFSTSLREAE